MCACVYAYVSPATFYLLSYLKPPAFVAGSGLFDGPLGLTVLCLNAQVLLNFFCTLSECKE